MSDIVVTSSASETQMFAEAFAQKLHGGDVVALYGELGSGKTTFVQGLARGLGVHRRIISPTFIIVRTYRIKNQKSKIKMTIQNSKNFYHIDLYRIESEEDFRGLGLQEILRDKENIVAIEWAEKARSALPRKRYEIYFDYVAENKRKIRVMSPDV